MARQRKQAPPGQRQLRMGEEIRHALAHVFEREEFRDPDLHGIKLTVTEVRPSADLRHARVYIVPLGGGDPAPVLKGLGRVKSFLRRRVAEQVHSKFVPDLIFAADSSFDRAQHISDLLHRPEVARDLMPHDDGAFDDDADDDDEVARNLRDEEE